MYHYRTLACKSLITVEFKWKRKIDYKIMLSAFEINVVWISDIITHIAPLAHLCVSNEIALS